MRDSKRLKIAYGGVTINEDGFVCPDGDLSVCMGMEDNLDAKVNALRHGPKSVMQMPSSEWTVLYVHHTVNADICLLRHDWTNGTLSCTTYHWLDVTQGYPSVLDAEGLASSVIQGLNNASYTVVDLEEETVVPYSTVHIVQVRHIGRTLVARGEDGLLHYMLWKEGAYKYLGTKFPELDVSFGLQAVMDRFYDGHEMMYSNIKDAEQPDYWSEDEALYGGISSSIIGSQVGRGKYNIAAAEQTDVTETVMAKVNKLVSKCHEYGWFCQPFLVRFALRLYDGTNTMQSPPVLMPVVIPSNGGDITLPWAVVDRMDFTAWHLDYMRAALDMAVEASSLNALKEWRDVVTGIDIAISAPLYTYDPVGKCKYIYGADDNNDRFPNFYDMGEYGKPTTLSLSKSITVQFTEPFDFDITGEYKPKNAFISANDVFYYSHPRVIYANRGIGTPGDAPGSNYLFGCLTYNPNPEGYPYHDYYKLTEFPAGQYLVASYSARNEKPTIVGELNYQGTNLGIREITTENAQRFGYILKEYSNCIVLYNNSGSSKNLKYVYYPRHNDVNEDHGMVWITSEEWSRGEDRHFSADYTNVKTTYRFNKPYSVIPLPELSPTEFYKKMQESEVFYKFCEIDLDDIKTERTVLQPKENVLLYLTSQPVMKDEYHTHEQLKADNVYAYNNRVNLCGMRSMLWSGFNPTSLLAYQTAFSPSAGNQNAVPFQITVEIDDEEGNASVIKSQEVNIVQEQYFRHGSLLKYLYYPRTKVKALWVRLGGKYCKIEPEDHTGLNGSVSTYPYMLNAVGPWQDLPLFSNPIPAATDGTMHYPSKLYTSEAFNPWVFSPENINTIGSGKILGMAIAAKSISEGTTAGTYPMYCMTDTGVWILQPNGHGGWESKQAIMSDIVTLPDAILELDSAVVMPTERGIMLLSGESGEVIIDTSHKSEPIDAKDLPGTTALFDRWAALRGLKSNQGSSRDPYWVYDGIFTDIAGYLSSPDLRATYDYKNHRIVFWQPGMAVTVVYDLFAKQLCTQPWAICGNVRSTGDCLVMLHDTAYGENEGSNVWTTETWHLADLSGMTHKRLENIGSQLLNVPDVGILVTRPIKGTELGMRDVRKQLDALWHQGRYPKTGLNIVVWGTQDYKNWHLVAQAARASGLYAHHGAHWMAFIVAVIAPGLPLADHIDSADLMLLPRLIGKSPAITGY